MLSVNDITMRFGGKDPVRGGHLFTFLDGRRYAITGPNGAGCKTTLMKILAGEME